MSNRKNTKVESKDLYFILGADDPEMQAIEKLLVAVGVRYGYATVGGTRVHPGNAYRAEGVDFRGPWELDCYKHVRVECEQPGFHAEHRIDHHRPGDAGYGLPPSEFLRASSIGQVILLLHKENLAKPNDLVLTKEEILFTAAADHCLGAAYRDECPGVDPEALLQFRTRQRAEFQGVSEEELTRTIDSTRERLWELNVEQGCPLAIDLTGEPGGTLPEAPESACREGLAMQAKVTDRDGRHKLVLMGNTTPEQVSAWMDSQKSLEREVYGDPARGFAGAYL